MENASSNRSAANNSNFDSLQSSIPKASSTLRHEKSRDKLWNSSIGDTSSSLGVVDINSVKDISAHIRSTCDELENYVDDLMRESKMRISKCFEIAGELSDDIFSGADDGDDEDSLFSNKHSIKPPKLNISKADDYKKNYSFDKLDSIEENRVTTTTGSFLSSSQLQDHLDKDEKENRRKFALLPASPKSFTSERSVDTGTSDYFRDRSYKPKELKKVLHNLKGGTVTNNISPCKEQSPGLCNNTYEISRLSSIASTSQIAQILRDEHVDTDLLIERLLNPKREDKSNYFYENGKKNADEYDGSKLLGAINNDSRYKGDVIYRNENKNKSKHENLRYQVCDETRGGIKVNVSKETSPKRTPETGYSIDSNRDSGIKVNINKETSPKRTPETVYSRDLNDSKLLFMNKKTDNSLSVSLKSNGGTLQSPKKTLESLQPLIPEKSFYKLVKTGSDFEEYDDSSFDTSLECSTASSYVSLLPKQFIINSYDDPNTTLASPYTANLVKATRMHDELHSFNETFSSAALAEPVYEVMSTCSIDRDHHAKSHEGNDDREVIDAGLLCVGTQVKVVLTVINPGKKNLRYSVHLKEILVNSNRNMKAANVMVSASAINTAPSSSTEISLIISPLVCGAFDVVVEFISEERQFPNMLRLIQLIGQEPSLEIVKPDNLICSFGLLPECYKKSLPLVIRNRSSLKMPLKFHIYEGLTETLEYKARYVIGPNEIFQCDLLVTTPEIRSECVGKEFSINGRLCVLLDTADEKLISISSILSTITLNTLVGSTFLRFDNNLLPLKVYSNASSQINVRNDGNVPLTVITTILDPRAKEFFVAPEKFSLEPLQQLWLTIKFRPNSEYENGIYNRETDINLLVCGSRKRFSFPVCAIVNDTTISSTVSDMRSVSNPSTPKSGSSSSNSSSSCSEGILDLACTHTALSWPCTSIYHKQIQNITLRNKSDHREKLVLSVCDNTASFKLVENDKYVKEIKIVMEANESRKISVVFIPRYSEKQISGKIVIRRRWNRLESTDDDLTSKRAIPLFGYGGEAKLSIQRVFRDSEGRMWLNPDSETLESTFLLKNTGDTMLFIKLCQDEMDDTIIPDEILLSPEKSIEVMCKLNLTADRVDILCRQNSSKDTIIVNNIVLLYGAEASRRRIRRLWKQKKIGTDALITKLSDTLDIISDFSEYSDSVKVDDLLDPPSALSKLWYESITEQTIGVLMNKELLESMSLDKTVVFNDLNTTITE